MSNYRNTVYQYFQTDDIPTEEQFKYTWNSIWFKDEKFSITDVTGLESALQNKLGFNHANDQNAHNNALAKLDASNLSNGNINDWKAKLGVGEIPSNVALVDAGENPLVYNKQQIASISMAIADYVTGGKIRADKIEALGLTDLIEATENTLAAFVTNSANYEFQKNDFIAVPDVNGNYSLFMFKGGDKTVVGSYLATGLSNITVAMVEGLQELLNQRVKITADGSSIDISYTNLDSLLVSGFFVGEGLTNAPNAGWWYVLNEKREADWLKQTVSGFGGAVNGDNSMYVRYRINGSFTAWKRVLQNVANPTESIHTDGRVRSKATVYDDNTESLPKQITYHDGKFHGTDSSGVKRDFQTNDYADFLATFSSFSQSQNTAIATILGGGNGSAGNPSVNLISPPMVQNTYDVVDYIMLQGANLYLGNLSKVEILASDKTTVVAEIPDNQVQQYTDGLSLIFYYNFSTLAEGQYFIRLTSGAKIYTTSLDLNVVNTITNIDLNTITWDIIYDPTFTPPSSDIASGSDFSVTTYGAGNTSTNMTSLKSSELFAQGDDFYIEMKLDLAFANFNYPGGRHLAKSSLGLGYSGTNNSLLNNTLVNASYNSDDYWYCTVQNNGIQVGGLTQLPTAVTVVFIKTGNLFRTVIGNVNHSITLSNNSGYSVFFQAVGRQAPQVVQGKIIKAFKFN